MKKTTAVKPSVNMSNGANVSGRHVKPLVCERRQPKLCFWMIPSWPVGCPSLSGVSRNKTQSIKDILAVIARDLMITWQRVLPWRATRHKFNPNGGAAQQTQQCCCCWALGGCFPHCLPFRLLCTLTSILTWVLLLACHGYTQPSFAGKLIAGV